MLIENIRAATQEIHKKTDGYLYPFFNEIKTREDYVQLLKVFYAFFHPVMEQIDRHIDKTLVADYNERRKIATLVSDLALSGTGAAGIAPAQHLPEIGNAAQAMGAYYVLEGSTMGGVFLSSIIAKKLDIPDKTGIAFFSGYGNSSKSMWVKFLEYIEHYNNEEHAAAVTDTARDTFRLFYEYITANLK